MLGWFPRGRCLFRLVLFACGQTHPGASAWPGSASKTLASLHRTYECGVRGVFGADGGQVQQKVAATHMAAKSRPFHIVRSYCGEHTQLHQTLEVKLR